MEEENHIENQANTNTPTASPVHSPIVTGIPTPSALSPKVSTASTVSNEALTPPDVKVVEGTKPEKDVEEKASVSEVESKYQNWSMVWAKQKGYPWWPAKYIIVDKLSEEAKKPLLKLIERRNGKCNLVRYITTEGKEFGWVEDDNIRPFKETFKDTITNRMIEYKPVVKAINDAIQVCKDTDYKIPQNEIRAFESEVKKQEKKAEEAEKRKAAMRHYDIGYIVVKDPLQTHIGIEGSVQRLQGVKEESEFYKELKNWESSDASEVVKVLNDMLVQPVALIDVLNRNNAVGETLDKMKKSSNIEISALADLVLEHVKQEVKYGIQSGEYHRCKEILN